MCKYNDPSVMTLEYSTDYLQLYSPGQLTPFSGIYRCQGCSDEIASNKGNPFPPQNHHQHSNYLVPIRWKLAVKAVQR